LVDTDVTVQVPAKFIAELLLEPPPPLPPPQEVRKTVAHDPMRAITTIKRRRSKIIRVLASNSDDVVYALQERIIVTPF
jgi:hypothetical protein